MKNKNETFLKKFFNLIFDILFPKICIFCQREGELLCEDCRATFDTYQDFFCLCEKPNLILKPGKCQRCKEKKLNGLYFPLSYEDERVKHLIQVFKYKNYLRELAKPLASFIITYFLSKSELPYFSFLFKNESQKRKKIIFLAIPLERSRMKRRGFNQAEEIAKQLADYFGLPLLRDCLLKIKKTPPQMELSKEEREENLRGAFSVNNKEKIKGKIIFLVDDIYTTGSTMEEAAKVLKEAGAKEVWGIALARAGKI